MKILCENTSTGLITLYGSDYDEKKKLKIGEVYWCEIKKARNYQFLKKFFALIRLGAENSPLNMPQDAYRGYVTMKAGFVDVYDTPRGKMALPQSIAFSSMDESEFEKLYFPVLNVIANDIKTKPDVIENELSNFF